MASSETKPPTTAESARALVARLYPNLTVTEVKELVSYDDRNYRLTVTDGEQYLLKVTNWEDSAPEGMLEGQNQMMLYLTQKHSFNVSSPILNVHNEYITRESFTGPGGHKYAIRVLKFIPGNRLFDYQMNASLLLQAGEYLGRLQAAINDGGYENEAIKARRYVWCLEEVPQLKKYLYVLEATPEKAAWVSSAIDEFETSVLGQKDRLAHAYIHHDYNEQNILVENGRISGVIDFGDICHVPRVYDIAIAIIYLMLLETGNLDSVLEAPRYVLQGFLKFVQLDPAELSVLLICARARLAQSLTLGMYTYLQQPGNEYILTTQAKGWKVMKQLAELDKEKLVKEWLKDIEKAQEKRGH